MSKLDEDEWPANVEENLAYLAEVFTIRGIRNEKVGEYDLCAQGVPEKCIRLTPPILIDDIVRPSGREVDRPIGSLRQGAWRLQDDIADQLCVRLRREATGVYECCSGGNDRGQKTDRRAEEVRMVKAKAKPQDFRCGTCGQVHAGLPTDYAFRLPDEVFALSPTERYLRTRLNSSFCTIDESRFFIRGIICLPFTDQEGEFAWGVWAEVSEDDHNTCLAYDSADVDGSSEPRFGGKLAHAIPSYHRTLGLPVEVQVGGVGQRPTFWLPNLSRHTLAREQRKGISAARHHQMLEACGLFDRPA